ncbi:hypothetical protein, partial [Paracoccus yeei]|uniref:hypothetical protein n=1 Tax=Paracoccus yeei TaxID=147645 RepID=UPI001C8EA779
HFWGKLIQHLQDDLTEWLRPFVATLGDRRRARMCPAYVEGLIGLDLPGKCGEHQLRNQEVFYGKREQTDAGISA